MAGNLKKNRKEAQSNGRGGAVADTTASQKNSYHFVDNFFLKMETRTQSVQVWIFRAPGAQELASHSQVES